MAWQPIHFRQSSGDKFPRNVLAYNPNKRQNSNQPSPLCVRVWEQSVLLLISKPFVHVFSGVEVSQQDLSRRRRQFGRARRATRRWAASRTILRCGRRAPPSTRWTTNRWRLSRRKSSPLRLVCWSWSASCRTPMSEILLTLPSM